MYKRIPPQPFLSNLIRATYHLMVNWLDGNVGSNFVSAIIDIFKLPVMLFESISNLLWIEFVFMWPIISLLILASTLLLILLTKDVLSMLSSFSSTKIIGRCLFKTRIYVSIRVSYLGFRIFIFRKTSWIANIV